MINHRNSDDPKKGISAESMNSNPVISKTKIVEEKLKIEKAYLDQLFESAQEAIVLCENDRPIIRSTKDSYRLFG